MSRIVVITGVGTGIGKTHVAEALLCAFPRGLRVLGYKPIESGADDGEGEDGGRLREASTFHVKHPPLRYVFRAPVSPHVAARLEAAVIDVEAIAASVRTLADQVDVLVVELPGGLFSPITENQLNVDLLARLPQARTILVAADRLGVLHDVTAANRAAKASGVEIDAVVLSAPEIGDASTGTNAVELARIGAPPVVARLERSAARDLAAGGALDALVAFVTRD